VADDKGIHMGLFDWLKGAFRRPTKELLTEAREHLAASRFDESLSAYLG
jgi:hypothetical protein